MDNDVFRQGMGAILSAYPNQTFDLTVYWKFLKDLSNNEFSKAINDIITTQQEVYPGTNVIALIRKKAKIQEYFTSGEAWLVVKQAFSSIGSWGMPKFKAPLIQKAVDIMGWKELCLSENQVADRAHFMKIYDKLVERKCEEWAVLTYIKENLKLIGGVK